MGHLFSVVDLIRSHFPAWLLLAARLGAAPHPAATPERYEAAVAALDPWIAREVAEKRVPCLSIALVDDQAIVWSKGYGFADAARTKPATAETVYRVGSVSKLFTDIAVMQLVEAGKLDLDAPVRQYLPEFAPRGAGAEAITLRQLMAHRSGLARESPVGSYFDPTSPGLAATVASLNATDLVYPPGTRLKYSNAAIATVGRVLETVGGEPFAPLVARRVLGPLGMTGSRFVPPADGPLDRAAATMWSYHGREFPAPTFELGIGPAACLDSSVADLGRFLKALFAGGQGANGVILRPETLASMFRIQFAGSGATRGFGLGFSVSPFEGSRQVGHTGAMYGCATDLSALPDEKLGVVVVAARDCANGLASRVADVALGHLLAVRQGRPLPAIEATTPLDPALVRGLAGHYRSAGASTFDLRESAGRLAMEPGEGGARFDLRASGADLVGDDALNGLGPVLVPAAGGKLRLDREIYERVAVGLPPVPPAPFLGLIGEYGWDHDVLYILEKEGRLHALIEWFFLYPLTQESPDVYAFPDSGLYQGEKLKFRRDPTGRATAVEAASVVFPRRPIDGEDGQTFRIQPVRPVAEIRQAIAGQKPPVEVAKPRQADLVDLVTAVPGIRLDIRYATANNFLGTPVYTSARALLQRPAAEALAQVQAGLAPQGYGLLIHDAYRPWRVTKLFWEATPSAQHVFVADPSRGSKHNRGCAVDLTLCDLATGQPITMTGGYDEFSDRSYPEYPGGTARQRWHRDLLRRSMEAAGFTVNEAEWWHFDFQSWNDYPILDVPFEALPPR